VSKDEKDFHVTILNSDDVAAIMSARQEKLLQMETFRRQATSLCNSVADLSLQRSTAWESCCSGIQAPLESRQVIVLSLLSGMIPFDAVLTYWDACAVFPGPWRLFI
jgi:hypothetical protein